MMVNAITAYARLADGATQLTRLVHRQTLNTRSATHCDRARAPSVCGALHDPGRGVKLWAGQRSVQDALHLGKLPRALSAYTIMRSYSQSAWLQHLACHRQQEVGS